MSDAVLLECVSGPPQAPNHHTVVSRWEKTGKLDQESQASGRTEANGSPPGK